MSDPTTPDIPNRPTVEHLASLFAKWGVMPNPHFYIDTNPNGSPCGCAEGALLVEACGSTDKAIRVMKDRHTSGFIADLISTYTGLPRAYLHGIGYGFSGNARSNLFGPVNQPELHAGWEDGRAVRDLVLPLKLTREAPGA